MAKKLTLGVVSLSGEIVRKEEKKEKKVRRLQRIPLLQMLRVFVGIMTTLAFVASVVLSVSKIWSAAATMWMFAFSFMFSFWLIEYIMHSLLRIHFDLYKTE